MEKQREEKMETRVKPGEFVPNGFSYPNNATVQNDFLYLRDENGNIIDGKVTVGDRITVLKVLENKKLALVQYPVGAKVKEGYVTNATNIIKYDNLEKWVNKGSRTNIYEDANTGSQRLGSVDPNEKATFLYRKNNMDNIVYNASGGTRNKSGFADLEGSNGGSGSGSNGSNPWPSVAPGSMVSGGFTFPNNAKVIGGSLQLMDSNKNPVNGTVTSGDSITVLDVGHSKQLALVQYPAGGGVKQGYVNNDISKIKYNTPYDWTNGSTVEPVYQFPDSEVGSFGTLNPYESATKLYKTGNRYHVVYTVGNKDFAKSGYVEYEGKNLSDSNISIPTVSYSGVAYESYGESGKKRPLHLYKIGNGSKILFAGFALHGWEDHWNNDGLALVKLANELVKKVGAKNNSDGLNGWSVYIASCMNPDGVIVNGTHNGPGRCAPTTRIDLNRCFPRGFSPNYTARNYTGESELGAPEAVALRDLIVKLKGKASRLVVIDAHGWLGCTYGNSNIASYFTKEFGFSHKGSSGGGYFSHWADQYSNVEAILLEYPSTIYSYSDLERLDCLGKTYRAMMNIIGTTGDSGNEGGSGSGSGSGSGNITVGSKVKITGTHWATGQVIPDWAKNTTHTVSKIDGDRALLKEVTSWIYLKDIILADGSGSGSGSGSGNGDNSFNATGKVINVETNLRVRKTPSTSGEIVGTINANQTVTITHKNGDWYKIASPIVGYVHCDFIQVIGNDNIDGDRTFNATGKVINVTSQLNIRSLPSTDGKVVGTLNAGEVINITHKNGDWYKIALPKAGYVHKDYIAIISGGTDGDIAYNKTGTVINVETNLRVRKTPSTGGEVVGTINANQTVSITHKNGDWYKISSPIAGYVHKDYIRVHDDGSNGNGEEPDEKDFKDTEYYKNAVEKFNKNIFPAINVNGDIPYSVSTPLLTVTIASGLEGNFGNITNGSFAINAKVNDGSLQFENKIEGFAFTSFNWLLRYTDKNNADFYTKIIHDLPNGASIQFIFNPLKLEFSIFIRQKVKELIPIDGIQNAEWLDLKITGELKVNFHYTKGIIETARKLANKIVEQIEAKLNYTLSVLSVLIIMVIALLLHLVFGITPGMIV